MYDLQVGGNVETSTAERVEQDDFLYMKGTWLKGNHDFDDNYDKFCNVLLIWRQLLRLSSIGKKWMNEQSVPVDW
jgi:hypothetical protein